jgi:hypothetical protein
MPNPESNPEPMEALRARYAGALEHEFSVGFILSGTERRPGECPANVFDFLDGLRLIVSREVMPDGTRYLHVSASFRKESRIADEMRLLSLTKTPQELLEMWRRNVPRRFAELSGDERELTFVGWSQSHVPHWRIEEPGPPA